MTIEISGSSTSGEEVACSSAAWPYPLRSITPQKLPGNGNEVHSNLPPKVQESSKSQRQPGRTSRRKTPRSQKPDEDKKPEGRRGKSIPGCSIDTFAWVSLLLHFFMSIVNEILKSKLIGFIDNKYTYIILFLIFGLFLFIERFILVYVQTHHPPRVVILHFFVVSLLFLSIFLNLAEVLHLLFDGTSDPPTPTTTPTVTFWPFSTPTLTPTLPSNSSPTPQPPTPTVHAVLDVTVSNQDISQQARCGDNTPPSGASTLGTKIDIENIVFPDNPLVNIYLNSYDARCSAVEVMVIKPGDALKLIKIDSNPYAWCAFWVKEAYVRPDPGDFKFKKDLAPNSCIAGQCSGCFNE